MHSFVKNIKNKKISSREIILVSLIFAIFAFIVFSIPNVFANIGNAESIQLNFESFVAGLQQTVLDNLQKAYDSFFGADKVEVDIGNSIKNAVLLIAEAMVVIFTLVRIAQEGIKAEHVGAEFVEKIAINAVIAMMVVASINPLMDGLEGMGNILIDAAVQSGEESRGSSYSDIDGVSGADPSSGGVNINSGDLAKALATKEMRLEGLDELVGGGSSDDGENTGMSDNNIDYYKEQLIQSTINVLQYVVWFPMLVCIFLMFSAFFEVKIRYIFAAIAAAAIAHEGTRGTGVRYFKKYLACWVKIAIYFVIAILAQKTFIAFYEKGVSATSVNGININLMFAIVTNMIAAMAMMQSSGLGDEIVGV